MPETITFLDHLMKRPDPSTRQHAATIARLYAEQVRYETRATASPSCACCGVALAECMCRPGAPCCRN